MFIRDLEHIRLRLNIFLSIPRKLTRNNYQKLWFQEECQDFFNQNYCKVTKLYFLFICIVFKMQPLALCLNIKQINEYAQAIRFIWRYWLHLRTVNSGIVLRWLAMRLLSVWQVLRQWPLKCLHTLAVFGRLPIQWNLLQDTTHRVLPIIESTLW